MGPLGIGRREEVRPGKRGRWVRKGPRLRSGPGSSGRPELCHSLQASWTLAERGGPSSPPSPPSFSKSKSEKQDWGAGREGRWVHFQPG